MFVTHAPIDLRQAEEWAKHLTETGRKPGTVNTYLGGVRQCLFVLSAGGRTCNAFEIGVEDVHYLWSHLDQKESVRKSYLRSLSAMVMYYTGIDIVKKADILSNRDVPDRVFIEKDDLGRMFAIASPLEKLILTLGAFMGLRRCEMRALRDCDVHGSTLTVHGKGHGDGLITTMPMPAPVRSALADYVAVRDGSGAERLDDHIIQTPGRDRRLHVIHEARLSTTVSELAERAGVRATTHSLRRLFGTTLFYDAETDVQTLKVMMRHADISTTFKCYVNAYDKRADEARDLLTGILTEAVGNY